MTAWIHRIDTLLPDFSFAQEEAMVKMQEWARDDRERRLVRAVYRHSGIERRHSVLRNYDGEGEGAFFRRDAGGMLHGPGTAFADGAVAAIVSAREPEPGTPAYRLDGFRSALVPAGEQDMTWRIGDQGFDIALSSYVPKLISSNIRELIGPALAAGGLSLSDVDTWAVHPGGKSIIDQVQRTLGLSDDQVSTSREVLRRCGNMSSATILFVLEEILKRSSGKGRERVCAVAFGPGLTVEMATLDAIFGV